MIKNTLKSIANCVIDSWRNYCISANAKTANAINQRKAQYIYSFMLALQQDLFTVIGGKTYSQLTTINQPAEIRIVNYRIVDDVWYFDYALTKSSIYEHINSVNTAILAQKINTDIFNSQHTLWALYGDNMINAHPFLSHGFGVVSARDAGTDIVITVQSNLIP